MLSYNLIAIVMLKMKYIQQYRMVKGRVAPPKCWVHVATQIKKINILKWNNQHIYSC